jgi:hypothetical protein
MALLSLILTKFSRQDIGVFCKLSILNDYKNAKRAIGAMFQ